MATKKKADIDAEPVADVEAAEPQTEVPTEAEPRPHQWKYIERPKGFHNQRCTKCKAERRSNSLN